MKMNDIYSGLLFGSSGSGGGGAQPYIVNMIFDEETEKNYLDKSAADIMAAMQGRLVLVQSIDEGYACVWPIVNAWMDDTDNAFTVYDQSQPMTFVAPTANDFPVQV